jgi:hypothetical protein
VSVCGCEGNQRACRADIVSHPLRDSPLARKRIIWFALVKPIQPQPPQRKQSVFVGNDVEIADHGNERLMVASNAADVVGTVEITDKSRLSCNQYGR